MWNAGLEETQAGITIAGRNINNLRYADDTTLMAESEEELKSLLMKVIEESEKAGLTLNTQKTKIMASSPITSWQIDGETIGTVTGFFLRAKKLILLNCGVGEDSWESLDCKEIQLVHPKDQSCVFIGRTDVEAETPILWPPGAEKDWLIWKDPDAGKD